ncbi:hypothetical protein H2201_009070 [Coniosporium apollinis]|uniref:Uncharacterized protein n=1 Tax=Coniosporium apollinis TaxID=61459 RepID=A0ABQ9NIS2_9PEZI|nr:hypothetical protein H2201_009070 [Coniosporium apollinis]
MSLAENYFEVEDKSRARNGSQGSQNDGRSIARRLLDQIKERRRKVAEKERRNKKIRPMDKLEVSPWLKRVRWLEHLAGHDMDELLEYARFPDKEGEEVLALMCESFGRVVEKAIETVETLVSTRVRFKMNRKERGQEPREPFNARMGKDTLVRYRQVCQRSICYVYRTYRIDQRERPPYVLTDRQKAALEKFVRAAEKEEQEGRRAAAIQPVVAGDLEYELDEEEEDELEEEEEQGEGGREEEEDGDEAVDDDDDDEESRSSVDRACLSFWIALLDHIVEDDDYSNALASGLAVLGITKDGTWQDAMDYTPKLSAVVKLSRMAVVEKAYQRAASRDGRCWHRMKKMVRRFMVRSEPTPMSWIYDVRTYGLKIRYTTTAQGSIWWEGETLHYQNIEFTMSQYRAWVHGLAEECRRFLAEELIMMKPEEQHQLPAIDWDRLRDNPADLRDGHFFVHDERNKFDVDGEDWLFERIMSDDEKRAQFYRTSPRQGEEEGLIIKKDGVEAYRRKVGQYKEKEAVIVHLTAGQPARIPELFSLRFCNTVNGGQRNMSIEGGMVKFVASYHKGYNNSGNMKNIHRYLPREVGETFAYFAWLVDPFIRHLLFAVNGSEKKPGFVWDKELDGNKWTPTRFR